MGVTELAVFGSVVGVDFRPDSDVDVVVRFVPDERPRGLRFITMKLELEDLLGRPVDLIHGRPIENPFRREAIARDRTVLYAA